MEIEGKICIVTGASSGIGLATAKLLTGKGAKVVLASRSKEKLMAISAGLPGSLVLPCDMTDVAQVRGMVSQAARHFGRVDVLVNNAGQGYDAPVEKIRLDVFRGIFELDVVGPLAAMEEAIPIMRAQGGGSVVNVSSGTALAHWPNMAPYSSLKRALAHISLTAREELEKDKISVSVVYPYVTLTDFEKNTIKNDVPEWEGELPHPPDKPELVAGKILEAIKTGEAEVFPHAWMKKLGR
jgi:short-subunit dehydrogenase